MQGKMENAKYKMKRLEIPVLLFFFGRTSAWYQFDESNFRRCQETYGRAPRAGTSAYIKVSIF